MKRRTTIAKFILGLSMSAILVAGAFAVDVQASEDKPSYTYNYDYWEEVQDCPDLYSVARVFTSGDLGLDERMRNPQGMYVRGNRIYVCDTGNNRILVLERKSAEELTVLQIIDSFRGDVDVTTFNNPTDVAVTENGDIFIADQGNARILKLDQDLNYLMQFDKPVDNTLDPKTAFQPSKITVDTAGRVYCIAAGINKGLIKYENDGTFSGFVGATRVSYDLADYIWKKFATQAQREKMVSFVPTEYDNLYMDHEGFIYACTGHVTPDDLRAEKSDAIRKLNLLGNDILVRNGNVPVYGDLYWGAGGGYEGPSYFQDVTVLDNDVYVCLDKNRSRLFAYDDQGRMVFAFGGNGNMDGYFRQPMAIEHMGHDLLVLDALDCAITVFVPTRFGNDIYNAIESFDNGDYDASYASWQNVMQQDGNYDLAYIGIGRALLRKEQYREAMKYFELKYDDDNYSKAYRQYRKIWTEDHIVAIVLVILALVLIPLGISRVRMLKRQIKKSEEELIEFSGK